MASQHEITRDILIKMLENGYVPKAAATLQDEDILKLNLEYITTAYKEIHKTVLNPAK